MLPDEQQDEYSLRPKRLAEFIGQQKVKDNLSISIQAARARGEVLDHVLLYGPPGLGKTTLASIIANEMGVAFQATSGPVIEDKKDLAAILSNVEKFQIFFIDEIHRLNTQLEELLYPALEDFRIDYVVGQGPGARTVQLNVAPFTLVGATTRAGLLSAPLRSRFGIVHRIDFYTAEELGIIVRRSADILQVPVDQEGGGGDCAAEPGDASYCEPAAAPRPRLCRSKSRRPDHSLGGPSRAGNAGGGPLRFRRGGP